MVVRDSFHNFHVNAASFQSEALADLDKLCTDRHSARSGAQNLWDTPKHQRWYTVTGILILVYLMASELLYLLMDWETINSFMTEVPII